MELIGAVLEWITCGFQEIPERISEGLLGRFSEETLEEFMKKYLQ